MAAIPLWQRALGVATGALLGCWDVALMGGIGGLNSSMFGSIALELAGVMVLSFVGLLNPVTIVGMAVLSIIHNGFSTGKKLEKTVKQKVLEQVITSIHSKQNECTDSLLNSCISEMTKIKQSILENMNNEINSVQDRLNNLIEEKKKGDSNLEKYKNQVDSCSLILRDITNNLESYIKKIQYS